MTALSILLTNDFLFALLLMLLVFSIFILIYLFMKIYRENNILETMVENDFEDVNMNFDKTSLK
jgi:protein-S-isoprenylcysteine O-methyltransferase Ste14